VVIVALISPCRDVVVGNKVLTTSAVVSCSISSLDFPGGAATNTAVSLEKKDVGADVGVGGITVGVSVGTAKVVG